jgi:predicted GIY-YIG superfamily endonuclease
MACVYQIRNKVDGKIYVGSTKNFEVRKKQHINQLDSETHDNTYLQNAWNKYGENNFEFSILEEVELKEQFVKEQEWINKLNPFDENGYNILRLTYKGAESPHLIEKECCDCGEKFETYNYRALRCDKCRELIKRRYEDKDWEYECLHCKKCIARKECFLNNGICEDYRQCDFCKKSRRCNLYKELLEIWNFVPDCIYDGYDSPEDFWNCNGI